MPQNSQNKPFNFENTSIAFKGKSNADLNRAYWLFKMIANSTLVKVGTPLTIFALKIGLPITRLIKKTIFKHFCGGESISDCEKTIQELAERNVGTILDYSVEGEENEETFDHVEEEVIRSIERAKKEAKNIPFAVFKITGLGRFDVLAKTNLKESLSKEEQAAYLRITQRVDRICKAAHQANIKVLIDGEHSWIQNVIDDLARDMMLKYNQKEALVFNTYQLYRHDKLASLQADLFFAKTSGFHLGAKLVRGAYMEIERERALEQNYNSLIQPNKQASDHDYDAGILFCLDHLVQMGLMAGTHNETSSQLLANEMDQRGFARDDQRVHFAQLLGMSDNLSFNLAEAGFNVAKYMPYGPVKSVMPYLFRRAQENTSVAGQTGRELSLIIREKNRRKKEKH